MADNQNKELMEFLGKQFEGIYKRLDNTASKDDLTNFATKDDLTKFATKDDLANFATKDDLAKFATKDDLKTEIAVVKNDLANFATKDDLETAIAAAKEETMRHTGVLIEDVKHKLDIVIEGVMGVNERLDRRTDENEQEHRRMDKMTLINSADISKLDKRVVRLEGKV